MDMSNMTRQKASKQLMEIYKKAAQYIAIAKVAKNENGVAVATKNMEDAARIYRELNGLDIKWVI